MLVGGGDNQEALLSHFWSQENRENVPVGVASSIVFLLDARPHQSTRRKPEGRNKLAVPCSTLLTDFSDHSVIITMRANPDPNEILTIFYAQRSMLETNPD